MAFLISQDVLVIGQLDSLSEPRGLTILHAVPPEVRDFELTPAAAKSLQWCPTLCDPMDGSPPGSPIPGILQARTLEGVAISFSNAWKWKMKVKSLSHVRVFATPWTAVYQAPLPMGFSRQRYWNGLPLPSPELTAIFSQNNLLSFLPYKEPLLQSPVPALVLFAYI